MLTPAEEFWKSIEGKIRSLVEEEMKNSFQCQRYDVTTAPDGSVIGVTQPFGETELFIPYSQEVATAVVGDTVLVVWWASMSNAKAYYFADGYRGSTGGESHDGTYIYHQDVASDTWTITHNLGAFPSVTVVDSGETVVVGSVQYINENSLVVTFSGAFSGTAYLN